MNEMIIEVVVQIMGEVVLALVGAAGAWLMAVLAKQKKLANISAATQEVVATATQTAAALQQTTVEKLKAAHEDGKLSEEEITDLGITLLEITMKKLSQPAKDILAAAGKDVTAIIQDAAEEWLLYIKGR